MPNRIALWGPVGVVALILVVWAGNSIFSSSGSDSHSDPNAGGSQSDQGGKGSNVSGKSEQSIAMPQVGPTEPVVIADCRLTALEKQEVPSQRDGVVDFIGTEITSGREELLLLPNHLGPILIAAEATVGERQYKYITVFEDG